ncbi:MAG: alpha/beta fold hydrolase BchO [Pseudomonadota bacterium]
MSAAPERSSSRGNKSRPLWQVDGTDWPNREFSRFVQVGPMRWHVQEAGPAGAPTILLAHGTGAATHSWRWLLPDLARDYRVIAPDLPAHGFTSSLWDSEPSLQAMAKSLAALTDELSVKPDYVIGHSAGAAILIRMTLDGKIKPRGIIGLNAALLPFDGIGRTLFPSLARMLFLNPFVPHFFAWQGRDHNRVARLLKGTGSNLPDDQIGFYARLFRHPSHITGALGMMTNWDLAGLERELRKLDVPLRLIVGTNDATVPPGDAATIAKLCPAASVDRLGGLGHLAHEEDAATVGAAIHRFINLSVDECDP